MAATRQRTLVTLGFEYGPPSTDRRFDASSPINPAREEGHA